jgi:hypothetical protein
MAILGTTGLKQFGGMVDEEWHIKLRGKRGVKLYREMSDNCAVIGAFLFAIEMFVRQVEWHSVPADEDNEQAVEAQKFLDSCIDDMAVTWDDFVAEVLTMLPFGWSLFEEVYKRRVGPDEVDPSRRSNHTDGRIGWRKFGVRAQDTLWKWELDEDGTIKGMWQWDMFARKGLVLIPIEKALLFRTRSAKNNPEGRSILRNSFRSWMRMKRIQDFEAIGIERELAGMPVFEVPVHLMDPNASVSDRAIRTSFEQLARRIRMDELHGLVIPTETDINGQPTGYKFRLATTGGRRAIDASKTIERYEKRITTTVLHDWVLLGQDKVGSFALSDSKTQASSTAVGGFLGIIKSVINRVAIPRLFRLNPEFPREVWPSLEHGDIEIPDLTMLGDFITKMIGSGALSPDNALERHIRQKGSLPEKQEDPDLTPMNADPARPGGSGRMDPQTRPRVPGQPVPSAVPATLTPEQQAAAVVAGVPAEGPPPTPADVGGAPTESAEVLLDPKLALNGAQVTAIVTLLTSVGDGTLPRESAIELIVAAFPISRDRAEAIMGTVGTAAFTPATGEAP